jgi:hypothetical protein
VRDRQRGLTLIGAVIVVAILAAAGYYLYSVIMETDTGPGCKDDFTLCMRYCRRTTTDDASAQKCQENCRQQFDECSRQR